MNNEKSKTSVVLSDQVFRNYMFSNYMSQLPKDKLLEFLHGQISQEFLVDLAQGVWDLPFDLCDEEVVLCDADNLLAHHTTDFSEDCEDCPDLWSEQLEDWPLELSFDEPYEPEEEANEPEEEVSEEL
jgi:hypothetical protein